MTQESLVSMRMREQPTRDSEVSMIDIDRLIPIRDAFSMIGLGNTKGYGEIAEGRLRVVRNGRRTFVRASEVQRYIDALSASQSAA